jgi:hypothetical protein
MKKLALIAIAFAATVFASQQPAKKAPAAPAARPSAPARPELPANAEKVREGVWSARDSSGKTWYYARSPFGYSRMDESAYKQAYREEAGAPLFRLVSVDGEIAKFERETSFGKSSWTRKLSELTQDEKAVYDLRQQGAASGQK